MNDQDPIETSGQLTATGEATETGHLIESLVQRCEAAGIEHASDALSSRGHVIRLQCGRLKRDVRLGDKNAIERALSFEFEKYTFLGDYGTIVRSELRHLEAGLELCTPRPSNDKFFNFLKSIENENEGITQLLKNVTFDPPDISTSLQVEIGPPTDEFCLLAGVASESKYLTLKITGIKTVQHDELVKFLERLSDAVCLFIELNFDTPLILVRRRPSHKLRIKRPASEPNRLQLPSYQYERAPVSLYFYGRSATGLPLVQFLAFYQVLEFYFPVCHRAEAGRRVKQLLKDPTFNKDRDSDISRMLDCAEGKSSTGNVTERNMLRSTIAESTDLNDLLAFLRHDEEAAKNFKGKLKGITNNKISFDTLEADLLTDVTNRVYDIRCKIVHTKVSDEDSAFELVLPNSTEANTLHYDIELMQFLAKKALIYGSHPFNY